MICSNKNHNNQPIKGICINPNCHKSSYGCEICIQKQHQDHQILNLDDIEKHIKTLTFNTILPNLMNQCQENATQLQTILKDIEDFYNGFKNKNTILDLQITAFQLKYLNSEENQVYTEFLSNAILEMSTITQLIKEKTSQYLQNLNELKQTIAESDAESFPKVQKQMGMEISIPPRTKSCQKCKQQSQDPLFITECNHSLCFKCVEASLQQQPISKCPFCNTALDKAQLKTYYRQNYQRENYYSNVYEQNSQLNSSIFLEEIDLTNNNIKNLNSFIEIFDYLLLNQIRFKDPDFPHDDSSIGIPYCNWMNSAQLYFNDYLVFTKDVEAKRYGLGKLICPNDIAQGALGNCYFLASISALGNKRPDLLLNRFITRSVNPVGIYCMSLCIDGEWTAIWVDDYFPVANQRLVFTTGRNQAIWVMLLEKAWAKLYKSYKNTEAGYVSEALRILTGAPSEDLSVDNPRFIEKLQQYLEENAILTASSGHQEGVRILGLAPSHAYSILKIVVIKLGTQFVQLIKLRNPWGKQEWRGDWSQSSPLWTPELRERLELDVLDKGIFFMELGQFMQYFHFVQICHVKDNYQYSSLRSQSTLKKGSYFSVKVKTPGKYYFSVIQNNSRMPNNPQYSFAKILVCKKQTDSFVYINGKADQFSDVNTMCDITEGEYIIYVKIQWNQTQKTQFTVSSYGPDYLQITEIEKQKDMLRSAFLNLGMSDEKKNIIKYSPLIESYYQIDIKSGWGYMILDNSSNMNLNCEIQFILVGIQLCKPFVGQYVITSVKANNKLVIVLKCYPPESSIKVDMKIAQIIERY